jgi:phosphoglycerate dehydrogenase-like enzyme
MKMDGVLVNVGRGGIVDEQALLERLVQGKLAGAAADVFAVEPPGEHPLLRLDNFVATPHVAAQTENAQQEIGERIVRILAAFAGGQDIGPHGVSVLK